MAYSTINNGIKQEPNTHFHDLLHAQLSAEDPRNTDNQDSAEDSGESPLDFSIKRKSKGYEEVSGSDSLSSPASASSLNDTGGHSEDRKSSDNDNHGRISNRSMSLDSPRNSSPSYGDKHFSSNESINQQLSPIEERIGQPKTADHEHSSSKHGIPNMINDLQMGLANANMLANSFPAMAALMDPMRMAGSSKGSRRPFKAYPSDAMSMAERTSGIPQYLSSFATFENSAIMQGLNLTSEEIFSIYKQQLLALRERNKYLEVLKLSQEHSSPSRSSTSTISSAHTSIPSSLTSMHFSTLTPSISSMNLTNKNNSFNNNMIGSIPSSPLSSSSPIMNQSNVNKSSTSGLTPGGRRRPRSLPDDQKDESYWERRRKNNDAAKRSRDSRRAKEDEIAIRAALLEQENLKLRVEVAALKTETAKLRCMLYNS